MHTTTDDLYHLLGVSPDADTATIRRAYRRRMRQFHPDMQPEHQRANAHEKAAKLTTAWDFLSNPVKRRDYDVSRAAQTTPPPRSSSRREPPPPPRRRTIVLIPESIDFGTIRAGASATAQTVWISFRGGSQVRLVQLGATSGQFWQATVIRADDERSVRIQLTGLTMPINTAPGRLMDELHVQVDEVAVDIPLSITVKAAPRASTSTTPPAPPQPEPTFTARPSRFARGRFTKRSVVALVLTLAVLLIGQLGGHLFGASTPSASGEYCSVSQYNGQMLSFYRTKPGTTERASDTVVWSIMTPSPGDLYLSWWTPQFPYWERANQDDGFTKDGQTYGRFQYVEVLPVWHDPWEPLSAVFSDYPRLTGGPATEATERRIFVSEWSARLTSPSCA